MEFDKPRTNNRTETQIKKNKNYNRINVQKYLNGSYIPRTVKTKLNQN